MLTAKEAREHADKAQAEDINIRAVADKCIADILDKISLYSALGEHSAVFRVFDILQYYAHRGAFCIIVIKLIKGKLYELGYGVSTVSPIPDSEPLRDINWYYDILIIDW